ncbi:hypothetical protein QYE76_013951 [Lolium multiflorum]|uniref:Bifunctional inhibitor/plant lipid transfer protein/seed storage helical domain-containing protein n=1 Tax=Lolium multiflorum TaxID=4521 RepID=A0AAD8U3V3_LOLMU|nr:hypothetical protein QYE76_013951 [Lolium multiflorum]
MAPAPHLRQAVLAAMLLLLSTTMTTMCGAGAAQHVSVPPSAATAAAPAPAAAMDAACLNSLLNMSDCLPYVQAGSATARPDAACCPELAGMVGSNPLCLCELLSGAADSYGIAVDYTRALALPGVCRVETPPVSTCAAFGYNVRGLAPSPAPMSGSPAPGPSGDSPQFPGVSPFPSPPAPRSHGDRRSTASGNIITLAVTYAFATAMII